MGTVTELPAGWTADHKDLAQQGGVYCHENQIVMVRYSYEVEGYQVFNRIAQRSAYAAWAHGAPDYQFLWIPQRDTPVFDNPISAMMWLEVESG